jgi:hypothetical protein
MVPLDVGAANARTRHLCQNRTLTKAVGNSPGRDEPVDVRKGTR